MRTNRYRFIEWRDFKTGEVTDRELYDHQDSLHEDVNVVGSVDATIVNELTKQLIESHPRKQLVMTPAVHSNPNAGRWKAELSFANNTKTALMVYPITPAGKRGRVRKVIPQGNLTLNGRIGDVYVVESRDGSVHEIHSPSFPTRPVVIE